MPALVSTHHQMARSAAQIAPDQHYQEALQDFNNQYHCFPCSPQRSYYTQATI